MNFDVPDEMKLLRGQARDRALKPPPDIRADKGMSFRDVPTGR